MSKETGRRLIASNRKARHDYHIEDTYEAGIVLQGTEVKSLRAGRASLVDAFADIENGEMYLHALHIATYTEGTWTNHEPRRRRKLLLHRAEIDKIEAKVKEKGFTLVPLQLYFVDGRAKVEVALAKGKKSWDKRQAIAERTAKREARSRSAVAPRACEVAVDLPAPPLVDADVPAWWRALGLPGLFDVHVHFMPPRVQRKVWAAFDAGGPLIGRDWPIRYRYTEEERVAVLRALGVRHFSALSYAHVPGMAETLNEWAADFAARTPEALRCATFFPEDGVTGYVEARVRSGVDVFKVHVQVSDFDPNDPALAATWGLLADVGTPVVLHAGRGRCPGPHTGPHTLGRLLHSHPRLVVVLAHMGLPEYGEFLALADGTRACTSTPRWPSPASPKRRRPFRATSSRGWRDLQERILLGSDFPSIPYPYAHQLESLARLELGDDWLRSVCWGNGRRLLGLGQE